MKNVGRTDKDVRPVAGHVPMATFDLAVLGGGTGNIVASAAAEAGQDVALVERGRLGGTCLNRGCNPSKKLIHAAQVVESVRSPPHDGVDASLEAVDFAGIVEGVEETVRSDAEAKAERAREADTLTFYQCEGRFVDDRTVEVDTDGPDSERLTADAVVLAGGSRPAVPDAIEGTAETDFLTSDDALFLDERPNRLVVVGGGYVAVELSYFFSQMGTDVTIVGQGDVLVDREDPDVAAHLTDVYGDRHDLHLGYRVNEIAETDDGNRVSAKDDDGEAVTVSGDRLLLAAGRQPNSDVWNVEAGGIETDDDGFVETDEFLETSADGVYAIGDIAGNYVFKHSGDKEAEYVVDAVVHGDETPVEYPGMAHAIFGSPQVAGLGETEHDLDGDAPEDYRVGTYAYDDTALGESLGHEGGFAKALVGTDGEVLGCHVVGPDASTLIHEVSTALAAGGDARTIAETIHVHPALSEVVQGAFQAAIDDVQSGI